MSRLNILFSGNERSVAVKKNIVYSILIRLVSIIVSFLIVPVTIGYVSAELYGVWLTLSSIMAWLSFMDIGFTQGLKNRLTEAIAMNDWDKGRQLVSTTYYMMTVIFIPLTAILILLVPLVDWCGLLNINAQYEKDVNIVIKYVLVFAAAQMVVNVVVSVIAAFQKVALSSSFIVIGHFLSLVIIVVLTYITPPSLLYLTIALCSMPILVTIVASFLLYKTSLKKVAPSFSKINLNLVKDLFGLGYKFFIINIQALVLYQSTNVLISYLSSPIMVTSYNLAYRYLNLAMMLFTIITAPLWPAYTDAYAKSDFNWMINMRRKMYRIFLISIIVGVIMVVISPLFYKIWVGDKAEVPLLMTLLVASYVGVYCWMNLDGTLIVGMGKLKIQTILCVFGMIIHIPLSFLFSRFFGAYGVLISLIILTFIYAVFVNIQVKKILGKTAHGIWLQ